MGATVVAGALAEQDVEPPGYDPDAGQGTGSGHGLYESEVLTVTVIGVGWNGRYGRESGLWNGHGNNGNGGLCVYVTADDDGVDAWHRPVVTAGDETGQG